MPLCESTPLYDYISAAPGTSKGKNHRGGYDGGYNGGYDDGYKKGQGNYDKAFGICAFVFKFDGFINESDDECRSSDQCEDNDQNTIDVCLVARTSSE